MSIISHPCLPHPSALLPCLASHLAPSINSCTCIPTRPCVINAWVYAHSADHSYRRHCEQFGGCPELTCAPYGGCPGQLAKYQIKWKRQIMARIALSNIQVLIGPTGSPTCTHTHTTVIPVYDSMARVRCICVNAGHECVHA